MSLDLMRGVGAGLAALLATLYLRARQGAQLEQSLSPEEEGESQATARRLPVDPDRPFDEHGRVHHLQISAVDVAHRILSVGDVGRAERIAALFDEQPARRTVVSSRGFVTITGCYKSVPVSIVATGMGLAMMDFVVRECRAVLEGKLAVLRLGTCGGLKTTATGTIVVAQQGAILIRREPDFYYNESDAHHSTGGDRTSEPPRGIASHRAYAPYLSPTPKLPYSISSIAMPDKHLSALYADNLRKQLHGSRFEVVAGVNASCDSFYSSQGRQSLEFDDRNADLLGFIERETPAITLEMETFQLHSLARTALPRFPIAACGAHICVWNRHMPGLISRDELVTLELNGGKAALEALVQFPAGL